MMPNISIDFTNYAGSSKPCQALNSTTSMNPKNPFISVLRLLKFTKNGKIRKNKSC